MNIQKFIGVLLIVLGGLALAYGGFSYTKETHQADLGPLHMEVKEQKHVNVPMWAGIAGLVAGVFLLAVSRKS